MGWWGPDDQDLISPAVAEALAHVAHCEQEWDVTKLEKRIRQYFRNAIKGLEFGSKPWNELIDDYADRVFASLFQALGDRSWVNQVDFLLVVDAGVKELFPSDVLQGVPKVAFERAVLASTDRAFEEQRYAPILWECIQKILSDAKARKKVYDAFENGRKGAANELSAGPPPGVNPVEAFVRAWIVHSISRLEADCKGDLQSALPVDVAVLLFHSLIEDGALPLPLVEAIGPPPLGWPVVDDAVAIAYGAAPPAHGRPGFGLGKGKGARGQRWAAAPPPGMGVVLGWAGPQGCGGGSKRHPQDGGPDGKRQRISAAPPVKAVPLAKGHPSCTQAEDCIGTPASPLFRHVEGAVLGDIYCASCWAVFADADPKLTAEPYVPE